MSNCALSMDGEYSFTWISVVMEMHFFSMFFPGFFTGWLISLYGSFYISILGTFLFGLSSFLFALGDELWNYFTGMIFLGIAWNFSFSAATGNIFVTIINFFILYNHWLLLVMLTACYAVCSIHICMSI